MGKIVKARFFTSDPLRKEKKKGTGDVTPHVTATSSTDFPAASSPASSAASAAVAAAADAAGSTGRPSRRPLEQLKPQTARRLPSAETEMSTGSAYTCCEDDFGQLVLPFHLPPRQPFKLYGCRLISLELNLVSPNLKGLL